MDDVTMVKNDDNTFSLTYQTQTVIQKGDFIVRDQKLNKYTLNDIEFDLLSGKTCTADFYYGDNIDSYILFKFIYYINNLVIIYFQYKINFA